MSEYLFPVQGDDEPVRLEISRWMGTVTWRWRGRTIDVHRVEAWVAGGDGAAASGEDPPQPVRAEDALKLVTPIETYEEWAAAEKEQDRSFYYERSKAFIPQPDGTLVWCNITSNHGWSSSSRTELTLTIDPVQFTGRLHIFVSSRD